MNPDFVATEMTRNLNIPVNGTREALFAFAQTVLDRSADPFVIMPNPFYQIYEGAALLAGAKPWYLNTTETNDFFPNFKTVPNYVWKRCQKFVKGISLN